VSTLKVEVGQIRKGALCREAKEGNAAYLARVANHCQGQEVEVRAKLVQWKPWALEEEM
jgi:hypothetical protein